ncbi:MAG TPA: hypothetical protein VK861_08175, partial [Bacteroidales bacterium]|nr:hypothetical protein [Bacteroidales bacterium]
MKSTLGIILVFVTLNVVFAQNSELYHNSKPASTNVPGVSYPRIDDQNRAIFRVDAPDARHVQLDLLRVYDMVKDEDGVWTVTTDPRPPGFQYYYLMIDGYRFADP